MRIKSIEYENFRNFRDRGVIKCSTDGKMTIVYGHTGDGKTTLHQLFQWVFFGSVSFNKTASTHLYNLSYEHDLEYGEIFDVLGRIDFEHNGENYSLTRKQTYKKGFTDSERLNEEMSLQKQDPDFNWKKVERPAETIEKLLPSGLAEYFFFDGERMLADLKVKGKDSADKLKKTIYSMFDLDVIEAALNHIGRTDLKTTALGKLYLSKGQIASGSKIAALKTNIESAQNEIDRVESSIRDLKAEKQSNIDLISSISEQIGSVKTKEEYEKLRGELRRQRDLFLDNAKNDQAHFGDVVVDMFPRLLVSKAVNDARSKLDLKVNESKLPAGISKRLIAYLSNPDTKECICGNPLCDQERDHIRAYLDLLPPRSYSSIYHDFTYTAEQWGRGYDQNLLEDIIKRVFDNMDAAVKSDARIKELDEEESKNRDIEELVYARQHAEEKVNEVDQQIVALEKQDAKYKLYLKKQMRDFDELTNESLGNQRIQMKIDILEEVAAYFSEKLEDASIRYSESLENNIQNLLDRMLTNHRRVSVSPEFAVRVTDSYDDESKSEGQFAVVSFAYIGGIFEMLKEEKTLSTKEFPLVLDGPFSKLDANKRQSVVDMLPQFAPQVIIFSKDDLRNIVPSEHTGRVWSIHSNEEQNVARIEEGIIEGYFD